MKRIFMFAATALMTVSCLVDGPSSSPVDADKLHRYAMDKLVGYVDVPVEALELALEFERYLSLPESEKESNMLFYGNIKKLDETKYQMMIDYSDFSDEYRIVECRLDTKGVSLWSEGASWIIESFSIYGNDFGYSYRDYSFVMEENVSLMNLSVADSTWVLPLDEDNVTRMKMRPMRDDLYEWVVEAQGTETTSLDVKAEFGTAGEFIVRERKVYFGVTSNVHSGRFNMSIYRGGQPYDYCNMIFVPGMMSETVTSRD